MIVCPTCQHKEYLGTLFCSDCGARLVYQVETMPKTVIHSYSNRLQEMPILPQAPHTEPSILAVISLKVMGTGHFFPLPGNGDYTLGRVSGNQPILPDIDLTPYQAYEGGVSRLHATVNIKDQIITIIDLGSPNGTRVNGKKIDAHNPYPLKHGDILSLGKFKAQILVRK